MKTIGLLGGMSWESTLVYYRLINEGVKARLGGLHSAELVLYSVDFHPVEKMQHANDWAGAAGLLSQSAGRIEAAGADFLVLCTNTMHKVARDIESSINIPLLHIADATAENLALNGVRCAGLLGTGFTMEQDYIKKRLSEDHGLEILVPAEPDRAIINQVIYRELCLGRISSDSRSEYLRIIDSLASDGAEAVILGCTEIGMLVHQSHTDVMLVDTASAHAQYAVDHAFSDNLPPTITHDRLSE
jgi:aspartate racemase